MILPTRCGNPFPMETATTGHAPTDRGLFRVCTSTDFGAEARAREKRRPGQQSAACRMCRTRKVKCVMRDDAPPTSASNTPPPCRACRQAGLDCLWDAVDGRKRRKTQPSSDSQEHLPPGPTSPAAAPEPRPPTRASDAEQTIATTTDSSSASGQDSGVDFTTAGLSAPSTDMTLSMMGLAPISETLLEPIDLQRPQQFLAELCLDGTAGMPQSWPDFENVVLGLDFTGDDDALPSQSWMTTSHGADNALPGPGPLLGSRAVRLRYYRRFGPTAVIPGLRKLSIVVDPEQTASSAADMETLDPASEPGFGNTSTPGSVLSCQSKLFDRNARAPHPDIMPLILDVFFRHFGGHFPFLHPQILEGHIRSAEASSFLLNAIAALTARFCPFEEPLSSILSGYDVEWRRGAPFLRKAKEQLVPLLTIPAPEVVAGLLVVAWADFGDNNEAGLWMFAGMAIRMAQDLGLHRDPEPSATTGSNFHDNARPSPDGSYVLTNEQSAIHQQKARLVMFWSVFIIDVCVSLVTGRPPTIRLSEIEVPIPTSSDMKMAQLDFNEEVSMQNIIFPETVAFMLHFSEAVEALNRRMSSSKQETSLTNSSHCRKTQHDMVKDFKSLRSELTFNNANLKTASASSQSGLFLMLHLFFHTFMALISKNEPRDAALQFDPNVASQEPDARACEHSSLMHQLKVADGACQKIVQIFTIAELTDELAYLATPFTAHCLFVAASMKLDSLQNHREQDNVDDFLTSMVMQDYDLLYEKLRKQARYFGAINSVAAALELRKKTLMSDGERRDQGSTDDEAEGDMDRTVQLSDAGIVNRYAIPAKGAGLWHS